jgi:DNA-binding transcriptional regulator YiaG
MAFHSDDLETSGAVQRAIADAYRRKPGLLTGDEIKSLRKERGLSQQALADLVSVGVASVKRWETGLIQSKSTHHALRVHLQCEEPRSDGYTGTRVFSLERVKLVLRSFENKLRKRLLKKADRMLFAAKYLWYADMVAYRELGRSMTGATYAALPYGPQLNNYRDLVDEIERADESVVESLTTDELRIIERLANMFPDERMIYDAAHREEEWKRKRTGAVILCSESIELTEA